MIHLKYNSSFNEWQMKDNYGILVGWGHNKKEMMKQAKRFCLNYNEKLTVYNQEGIKLFTVIKFKDSK